MSDMRIDVLGLECNTDTPDADGVLWDCGPIDGWASASIRGGSISPTGRHGMAMLTALWGGRGLRASGWAKAPTQAAAWDAYYRMAAILDLNESGELVVYEPTPKKLIVALDPTQEPKMSDPVAGEFDWDLALVAAFPFKMAATDQTGTLSGSATLTNGGRAAAYPTFTTTGSGAVSITIAGRTFTTDTVPSGTVIDMWARTVTGPDGSSLYGAKTPESEWLALPPGASTVTASGVSYSFADTYV